MVGMARALALRLAVALALAGCASGGVDPQVLRHWEGRPAATLEKDWGPPTREAKEGDLRIMIYEEIGKSGGQSKFDAQDPSRMRGGASYEQAYQSSQEAYKAPRVYIRSYLFWVNPEGKIVHAAVRNP
jgi:hypothetical protein